VDVHRTPRGCARSQWTNHPEDLSAAGPGRAHGREPQARQPSRREHRPLLLIGGERDPRCPPRQTREVAEKLRARGNVCDLIIYADEGHEISGLEHRVDYDRRTVELILEQTGAPA
jgi:dipeptidyl aminopeptidase/acylaminoacyl peptidase